MDRGEVGPDPALVAEAMSLSITLARRRSIVEAKDVKVRNRDRRQFLELLEQGHAFTVLEGMAADPAGPTTAKRIARHLPPLPRHLPQDVPGAIPAGDNLDPAYVDALSASRRCQPQLPPRKQRMSRRPSTPRPKRAGYTELWPR